jgi:hypothetical protein
MTLSYIDSYHLRCGLALDSGLEITLEGLHQEMTYAGLLEGAPDAGYNALLIEGRMRTARQSSGRGSAAFLIPPPRRDFFREPGDMSEMRSSGYVPEWLPLVTCLGSFVSVQPARNPEMDISVLTVVWFQHEYAFPILEPALSRLLALDWRRLADDIVV